MSVYKGKKALITGHTGFKGSWLSLWLTMLGAKVIGISLEPNTHPSIFNEINLKDNITHIIADIRDGENLKNIFKHHKPEIVFHLAAQPLVRLSYKQPLLTYQTNVMGTLNVFEAVRSVESVKTLINVTSDKCYENKEWVHGYKESDPMGGYDPYSSSKGMAELLTSSYRNSFFHPDKYAKEHNVTIASARAGNVIGGGDWAEDRLIPDCIKALSKGEAVQIRNPKAIRPWQHVLEPLSGYLLLGQKLMENPLKYSSGWNFGPYDNSVLTVEEIVKKTVELWGNGEINITPCENLHEANLLKLDISKAISYLNWKPLYNAEEALKNTVSWYKEFYSNNPNMLEFTTSQIKEYMKMQNIDKNQEKSNEISYK